jgi:beta propeller repeat protein
MCLRGRPFRFSFPLVLVLLLVTTGGVLAPAFTGAAFAASPVPLPSFDVAAGAGDQTGGDVGRFGGTSFFAWVQGDTAYQGDIVGRQGWGTAPDFWTDPPLDLATPYTISNGTYGNNSPAVGGESVVWGGRPGLTDYQYQIYGRSWAGLSVSGPATQPRFTISSFDESSMCDFDVGLKAAGTPSAKWLAVWSDHRGSYDVYGSVIDGATGVASAPFAICKAKGDQMSPRVSGNRVVWTDTRNGYNRDDIYGATVNLTTHTAKVVPIARLKGRQQLPDIFKKTVVWMTMASGKGRVYKATWGRPATARRIDRSTKTQWNPSVDGRFIVYQREMTPGDYDVWAYDALTRKKTLVAGGTATQNYPRISGNVVVWNEWTAPTGFDVKGACLPWKAVITANGKTRLVTRSLTPKLAVSARSNADKVRSYRLSYVYDRSSWTDWTLYDPTRATNQAGTYTLPDADGPHGVWVEFDDYSSNYSQLGFVDIYLDRKGPTTDAVAPVVVKAGRTASLKYRVMDQAWTTQAKVTIKIRTKGGTLVKTLALGLRPAGELFLAPLNTAKFVCTMPKGAYTFTVYATDLAGNTQTSAGQNTLTVN